MSMKKIMTIGRASPPLCVSVTVLGLPQVNIRAKALSTFSMTLFVVFTCLMSLHGGQAKPDPVLAEAAVMTKDVVIFEKLKDPDPTVRSSEARRLGIEKVKDAVPALVEALKDRFSGVRINAVVALGRIGDERAIEPLRDVLNNDKIPAARIKAAEALAAFEDEKILPELIKAADSKDERVAAAGSLGKTGGDEAVEKLIEKSRFDEKWRVRKAAIEGLAVLAIKGKGRNKKIEKAVKRAAKKDENAQVREQAEKALKKMPAKKKKWWFF